MQHVLTFPCWFLSDSNCFASRGFDPNRGPASKDESPLKPLSLRLSSNCHQGTKGCNHQGENAVTSAEKYGFDTSKHLTTPPHIEGLFQAALFYTILLQKWQRIPPEYQESRLTFTSFHWTVFGPFFCIFMYILQSLCCNIEKCPKGTTWLRLGKTEGYQGIHWWMLSILFFQRKNQIDLGLSHFSLRERAPFSFHIEHPSCWESDLKRRPAASETKQPKDKRSEEGTHGTDDCDCLVLPVWADLRHILKLLSFTKLCHGKMAKLR